VTHPIRFGTSGWRGILAEEITLPRVRALARGVGRWLLESSARDGRPPRVLVAHDTRFLGATLATEAVRVLHATGVRPRLAASPVPTPVVAHAVRHGAAEAGLVFTASHNPPADHGAKVIAAWGGGVTDDQARRIEALAAEALAAGIGALPAVAAERKAVDLVDSYLERLLGWVDAAVVRRARPVVLYDALQGTGAGVCDRALARLGARVRLVGGRPSPRFGGTAPDPVPARLAALAERVRATPGLVLGVATDGDADRYAVVDSDGTILRETEALALLIDRLACSGRVHRGVAISIATGSLVARIAEAHGLPVERHPIGFKHLARALADGRADVAGEESGGFAADAVARDKDGILACALLVETLAATRQPLGRRLRVLDREHGPSACARAAFPADASARARLAGLVAAPPGRVDGHPVRGVEAADGLRLAFEDGFLMLRASGTEPVLRIYAEAGGPRALARRLRAGRRLLGV
jgi:phosphoglucomutase